MKRPLYREIACTVDAYHRCVKSGNEWGEKHKERLNEIAKNGPSGSGIDNGTTLELSDSTGEKLVFIFSYHHMNEGGMYDGWTEHTLIVRPSLMCGAVLRITGRDRNQIKDYLHEVYHHWLFEEVELS